MSEQLAQLEKKGSSGGTFTLIFHEDNVVKHTITNLKIGHRYLAIISYRVGNDYFNPNSSNVSGISVISTNSCAGYSSSGAYGIVFEATATTVTIGLNSAVSGTLLYDIE